MAASTRRRGSGVYRIGLTSTLETLAHSTPHLVLIGDTPESAFDVPACLSAHLSSILACATPTTTAIDATWSNATQGAAEDAGATYVDPMFGFARRRPAPGSRQLPHLPDTGTSPRHSRGARDSPGQRPAGVPARQRGGWVTRAFPKPLPASRPDRHGAGVGR